MEQNMKKKISCGGFMLGEGLVLSEDGKTLNVSGGGGSMNNLNVVVFSGGSNNTMPDSCNVTYDALRGWIENGTPVFAVWNTEKYDDNAKMVEFFTKIVVGSSSLDFYYQDKSLGEQQFTYWSDGRMEPVINT